MNDLGQIKKLWTHRALYMFSTKDLRLLPKPRSLFEMRSNQSVAFVECAIKGEGIFRIVPACSGMFRNVPCSRFYRRPGKRLEHAPNKNGGEHNFIHRLSCSILSYSNGSLLIKPRKASKTFHSILSLLLMNDLGQIKKLWTYRGLYMYSTKDLRSLPKPRSLFEMRSNQSVAFVECAIKGEGKRGLRK